MPTAMCTVPLVLDRVYKGVTAKIKDKGPFFECLFHVRFMKTLIRSLPKLTIEFPRA